MNLLKKIILFTLVFTSISVTNTAAQETDSVVVVEAPVVDSAYEEYEDVVEEEDYSDTTTRTYERLYMDEDKLQALRSKKEFQYKDMDSVAMKDTTSIKPQTEEVEARRFQGFNANILLWLIIAVGVIIIIMQLAGVNFRQLFAPQKLSSGKPEDDLLPENIHDIPFEKAIEQAIAAQNYSLATRLMYLQSLKLLSDKNLISWHVNKTNWQYMYELKGDNLRKSFRNITHIFEYVQYGHMPITNEKFNLVQESFKNFKMYVI